MSEAAAGARLPECFRDFPGAVLHLSEQGEVLESNGVLEAELGAEVVGRRFAEVVDPESSRRKWERMLEQAAGGGPGREVYWELVLTGRDSLPEPRRFSAFRDQDSGRIWLMEHRPDPRLDDLRERVVGVNSELSNTQRELVKERGRLAAALDELEARRAELERSNRALDEFAHVVSHDLQAPLRSIANHATWLEADLGARLSGEDRAHLERVRDRVERMKAMIRGVLEFARAGRARARPERVDTGELLRDVWEMLDPPENVTFDLEREMPVLTTERAPLQQVLLNLVGNAVRYADPGTPRVRVAARVEGTQYEFSVSDNGAGIGAGARSRIWKLFYTGDEKRGTGIGLAVVKRLVEGQGGRVWVESEPGEGATFRFLWPTAPRREEGA